MTTEQREWTRLLAWEGCLNARDLGGYETEDGRETRWGTVVRSDSPAALTEAGRAALAGYGVRAIVDLRLPAELADDPNPFAEPGDHGIAYTNVSFIDPAAAPPDAVSTLAEDYLQMLDRYRQGVAEAMAAIARAPEGAVLIHCAAGKDRTGVVCALSLAVAGVPHEEIVADYAMTADVIDALVAKLATSPTYAEDMVTRDVASHTPRAETMERVLTLLDERHGGAAGWLTAHGFGADEQAALRARLRD